MSLMVGAGERFGIAECDVAFIEDGSVTSVPGVAAASINSGLRAPGQSDLTIIDVGAVGSAAGVFTANRATAAPVIVSRGNLADGRARAVIANSGCANACTGATGIEAAEKMTAAAAAVVGCEASEVLVASTGLIGFHLPIETMVASVGQAALSHSAESGLAAAAAIMTTDTIAKSVAIQTEIDDTLVTIGAVAKGAAMLAPSMATMLAFVTTDAVIAPEVLQSALADAVTLTFNRISVDACQSTNDTVLVLSNGSAGNSPIMDTNGCGYDAFAGGLREVCAVLADAMVRDGEGSTKTATVRVRGAATDEDALLVARAICSSVLVRCSLYGADPYWGRVVSEAGASGASFEPDSVSVFYGGIRVAAGGIAIDHDSDSVARHMAGREIAITCDLGFGSGEAHMITCDLGPGYIAENAGTS